jgi:hypothetical protein
LGESITILSYEPDTSNEAKFRQTAQSVKAQLKVFVDRLKLL